MNIDLRQSSSDVVISVFSHKQNIRLARFVLSKACTVFISFLILFALLVSIYAVDTLYEYRLSEEDRFGIIIRGMHVWIEVSLALVIRFIIRDAIKTKLAHFSTNPSIE